MHSKFEGLYTAVLRRNEVYATDLTLRQERFSEQHALPAPFGLQASGIYFIPPILRNLVWIYVFEILFFFFAERGGIARIKSVQVRLCKGKVMDVLAHSVPLTLHGSRDRGHDWVGCYEIV